MCLRVVCKSLLTRITRYPRVCKSCGNGSFLFHTWPTCWMFVLVCKDYQFFSFALPWSDLLITMSIMIIIIFIFLQEPNFCLHRNHILSCEVGVPRVLTCLPFHPQSSFNPLSLSVISFGRGPSRLVEQWPVFGVDRPLSGLGTAPHQLLPSLILCFWATWGIPTSATLRDIATL